jgi:hypothetical protein
VVEIYTVGESPDQESNPSEFVIHREIGNPEGMMYRHFEFAIRETPMSGSQLSAQQRRRTEL